MQKCERKWIMACRLFQSGCNCSLHRSRCSAGLSLATCRRLHRALHVTSRWQYRLRYNYSRPTLGSLTAREIKSFRATLTCKNTAFTRQCNFQQHLRRAPLQWYTLLWFGTCFGAACVFMSYPASFARKTITLLKSVLEYDVAVT